MTIEEAIGQHVALKKRGASFVGLCPFHTERTGSFMVTPSRDLWKCFGCGKGGIGADSFFAALGLAACPPYIPQERETERIWHEINWQAFTIKGMPARAWASHLRLSRAYSFDFCRWLYDNGHIGIYEGLPCFPIYQGSRIVRVHVRGENGRWFYHPKEGAPATAMVIAPKWTPAFAHVFESQWDMFAMMDAAAQHVDLKAAWIATRGACNARKVDLRPYANVRLYPQNDGEKRKGPMSPATKGEKWLEDALKICPRAKVIRLPSKWKDHNDALRDGFDLRSLLIH